MQEEGNLSPGMVYAADRPIRKELDKKYAERYDKLTNQELGEILRGIIKEWKKLSPDPFLGIDFSIKGGNVLEEFLSFI